MPSQIRSSTGCWTCKLRKKKCDEAKPTCAVCISLQLDCSGYGSRPRWMDAGVEGEAMLAKIHTRVKEITSQKKRVAMQQRQQRTVNERTRTDASPIDARPLHQTPLDVIRPQMISGLRQDKPILIDGPPQDLKPEDASAYIEQKEPIFLMHYLDNVFPCQFRFYQPSLEDGGRGWLLSLLMQTKPLNHAVLSLAAYHRQMMYCLHGGMASSCFTIEALQTQHTVAITELRRHLDVLLSSDRERSLEEDVQILCTIVFLISIEAYISRPDAWKMHLAAAITSFQNIDRRMRNESPGKLITSTFRTALSFFASVGLWYSIVSHATANSKPFLLSSYELDNKLILFEKVMGCENWVALTIKDIVDLDHWKNDKKAAGQLSLRELVNRGNEIEARLNKGFEEAQLPETPRPVPKGCLQVSDNSNLKRVATRVYYSTALVYLHVILSGPYPNLPEIRRGVELSIEAFKNLPDAPLVNQLIWPFCIAGCMALEHEEDFFTELALSGSVEASTFGVSKARVIIEECWRLRKLDPDSGKVDWRTAMDSLEYHILLV